MKTMFRYQARMHQSDAEGLRKIGELQGYYETVFRSLELENKPLV